MENRQPDVRLHWFRGLMGGAPTIITGGLIILIAVVFRSILHKSPDAVPLYLVPIFFYIGLLTSRSPKAWIGITVAITVALAILYALA